MDVTRKQVLRLEVRQRAGRTEVRRIPECASDFRGAFGSFAKGKPRAKACVTDEFSETIVRGARSRHTQRLRVAPAGADLRRLLRIDPAELQVDVSDDLRVRSEFQFDGSVRQVSRTQDNAAAPQQAH